MPTKIAAPQPPAASTSTKARVPASSSRTTGTSRVEGPSKVTSATSASRVGVSKTAKANSNGFNGAAKPPAQASSSLNGATQSSKATARLAGTTGTSAAKQAIPTNRTVHQPRSAPLSAEDVLNSLKTSSSVQSSVIEGLLGQLGIAPSSLHLQLLAKPQPSSHSIVSHASSSSQTPSKRSIILCKQTINATLARIGDLCSAGWKASQAEADASKAPRPNTVLHLVDAFRIGLRFLLQSEAYMLAEGTASEDRIGMLAIGLTIQKRLIALEVDTGSDSELAYLTRQVREISSSSSASSSTAIQSLSLWDTMEPSWLRFPAPDGSFGTANLVALVLDLQGVVLSQLANKSNLPDILDDLVAGILTSDGAVKSWLHLGQSIASSGDKQPASLSRSIQKTPLLAERCLTSCSVKAIEISKEATTAEQQQALRSAALRASQAGIICLMWPRGENAVETNLVGRRDVTLDRFGRLAVSVWRDCTSDKVAAYKDSRKSLETLATELKLVDQRVPADHLWTNCQGWTKVLQVWKWLAMKNADTISYERFLREEQDGSRSDLSEDTVSTATANNSPEGSPQRVDKSSQNEADLFTSALVACAAANALLLPQGTDPDSKMTEVQKSITYDKASQSMRSVRDCSTMPADSTVKPTIRSQLFKATDVVRRRSAAELCRTAPSGTNRQDSFQSSLAALFVSAFSLQCQQVFTVLPISTTSETALMSTLASLIETAQAVALSQCEAGFLEPSWAIVSVARKLLKEATENTASITASDTFQEALLIHWKVLVTTMYFIGGKVYNQRRYAVAVPFIRAAAEISEEMSPSLPDSQVFCKTTTNKWEFAALCYRHLEKSSDAVFACQKAIQTVPEDQWTRIYCLAQQMPVEDIFDGGSINRIAANRGVSHDGPRVLRLLTMLTDLSVCSLLIDQRTSDSLTVLNLLKKCELPPGCDIICLEAIVSCSWTETRIHYEGMAPATDLFIENMIEALNAEEHPVRRARALLRQIERRVLQQSDSAVYEAQAAVEEVGDLLDSEEMGEDAALTHLVPALQCRLSLLEVLIAYQRSSSLEPRLACHALLKSARIAMSRLARLTAAAQRKPSLINQPAKSPKVVKRVSRSPTVTKASRSPTVDKASRSPTAARARRSPAKGRQPLRATSAPKQRTSSDSVAPVTPPRKAAAAAALSMSASKTPQDLSPCDEAAVTDHHRIIPLVALVSDLLIADGHSLMSVQALRSLRALAPSGSETWCRATVSLSKQYRVLGWISKAAALLRPLLGGAKGEARNMSEIRYMALITQASLLAQCGDSDQAASTYDEAIEIGSSLNALAIDPTETGLTRVLAKLSAYERISVAAETFSELALSQGDLRRAMEAACHAASYVNRATGLLSQLSKLQQNGGSNSSVSLSADPFKKSAADQGLGSDASQESTSPVKQSSSRPQPLPSVSIASAHWRASDSLCQMYRRLAGLHEVQGSPNDSEAFLSEAIDVADGLALSMRKARLLMVRAELRLRMGRRESGEQDAAASLHLLSDVWLPEAAILACIQGDQLAKDEETYEEALKAYHTGRHTLRALQKAFSQAEEVLPSPAPSKPRMSTSTSQRGSLSRGFPRSSTARSLAESMQVGDELLPGIRVRLLRRQASLLQKLGRNQESEEITLRAEAVAPVGHEEVCEAALWQGQAMLAKAIRLMQGDPLWGMVPEAVLALPMVSSSSTSSKSVAEPSRGFMQCLSKAASSFQLALSARDQSRCSSTLVRQAMMGLAVTRSLRATVAKGQKMSLASIIEAIESSSAITLHRELSAATWSKISDGKLKGSNDPWLRMRPQPSVEQVSRRMSQLKITEKQSMSKRPAGRSSSPEGTDDQELDNDEGQKMRAFWLKRHQRCLEEPLFQDAESGSSPRTERALPENWTVISISVSGERNSLIVTRRSGHASLPELLFSLPVDRQSRREGEEEEMTIDAVLAEMDDIVKRSNDLTSNARQVTEGSEQDHRRAWWDARRELDERMKTLCGAVEARWLGPFKGIFMDPLPVSSGSAPLQKLRTTLEGILRRLCFPSGTLKKGSKVKLDDAIIETIAGLTPATTTDEDLEDLIHFIMDVHQFNGIPVAVDEVDFEVANLDIRCALEEFRSGCTKLETAGDATEEDLDHHIFLILDKDTAALPWESIPSLRGKAVCRIPSVEFLFDRIDLAAQLGATKGDDGAFHLPRCPKTYYLLNPSGDLSKSEGRFGPYLRSHSHWRGLIGRRPGPTDFLDGLSNFPLVLYFGHSGAEQYAKSSKIRSLSQCAVTMLWGCSSALLRNQGEFDRTGTPHNYMLAGSPAVVGQLLDATDKELDSIAESVLINVGLKETASEELIAARKASMARNDPCSIQALETARGRNKMDDGKGVDANKKQRKMSLARAVAQSRDSCRLPYLSGAAPVVWGVPVYFDLD